MKEMLLKNDVLVQVVLVLVFRWYCTTAQECVDGVVRDQLDDQSNEYAGEVQYCLNGTWSTVCKVGSSWTIDEARVVCRQLGYNDTGARAGSSKDQCTGTNSFVKISNCAGTEESLIMRSCNVSHISTPMPTGQTARVACLPGCNTNGEMRLVGGSTDEEGRVEVCIDRRWGTVCNNSQEGITGAVCSQLGFSRINAMRSTIVSARVGPVYQCTVNDSAIECTITNSSQCDHSNDLTVTCLTRENATSYLLSQLNKTNSSLQQCTNQSEMLQSSTSVLQALLAVVVVFLAGVIVGWIVTCCIAKNYLCHLCRKRHKRGNSSSSKMAGDQDKVVNDFYVSNQRDAQEVHTNSQLHTNLPDPHALPRNKGRGQGDMEFYTEDENRVYAAVVKPKKSRKNSKY